MSLTFTRRFLDADAFNIEHRDFAIFDDELTTFDRGPAHVWDGRVISTPDGAAWATLFNLPWGDFGVGNALDGSGLAVYKKNLFVCLCRPDPDPKVIEYNPSGGGITSHLTNLTRWFAYNLIVWNRSLWVITESTAPGKRIVYHYNGTAWTAITDYDGVGFLDYNIAHGSDPKYQSRHRTSRLFVFNNELYLIVSRYSSTTSKWAWEVWKFNAATYDQFNLIYDSEAFDDGYLLSAILEKDGIVYLMGNTISAGAGAQVQNPAKLYSSPDMVTWTAGATDAALGFPYGEKLFDGRIYLNCQNVATNRTQIKYINEDLLGFTQEQEIATNQNIYGGGMESFLGDLNIGKWMEIYAADGPTYKQARTKARSLVGIEMTSKNKLGEETVRRYGPIDTRAPTRFYSGKIRSLSSCQRSVDDITGLFRMADMSIELDNTDMEFSKILAGTEYFKNQLVKLYHMWADEPERLRQHIISLVVEDQSMKGSALKIKLKDIAQKYFEIKAPSSICTSDDYSDIHPDYEGMAMPEVLGLAEWSDGEDKGAVKAVYVDTTGPPFRYIASSDRTRLLSVDRVWADNVERFAGGGVNQYQITWGPPTTIDMNTDQGDADVSFNAKGYSFGAWDSVNGHVQNPAYIILYFLRFIMGIPFAMLNVPSFDALATIYDNKGVGTNGKLILQRRGDAMEILRQLLFSFGTKGFVAKDGRFKVERKDISNFQTNTFIFDQNDTMEQAERKGNLMKAMNVENARWDYIPWLRFFKSGIQVTRDTFDESIEDNIRMPWKDSPAEL